MYFCFHMINIELITGIGSSIGFTRIPDELMCCKCYREKYKNNLIRGVLKFVFSRLIKTDPCLLN